MKRTLSFLMLLCSLYSCGPKKCYIGPIPQQICFHVVDSKHALRLDSADLYWFENGVKQRENEMNVGFNDRSFRLVYPTIYDSISRRDIPDSTKPLLVSNGMMLTAASKGINVFYIGYGSNQIDTLHVDATAEDIKESGCKYKKYHLNSITYRGVQLSKDSIYYSVPNYTFLIKRD